MMRWLPVGATLHIHSVVRRRELHNAESSEGGAHHQPKRRAFQHRLLTEAPCEQTTEAFSPEHLEMIQILPQDFAPLICVDLLTTHPEGGLDRGHF